MFAAQASGCLPPLIRRLYLLNRLDVSKYYVIPTIIILDATVEGN
jgi:hypothetical protein